MFGGRFRPSELPKRGVTLTNLGRILATHYVSNSFRTHPNGFTQQAETAVVLPNEIPKSLLIAEGNRAYASVLSGLLTPEEAVCNFGQEIANHWC